MTISRNLSFLAEGVSSTGVLGATYGGTGQSSITTGDLLYGSASNTISKLAIGSTGTILRVVGGVPSWGTDYTGTVTSVAALTLGTTGTDLSSTVANGTTTPVITLNVPTASATNRGVLSSTDWTTFNNKGSGSVTSVAATVPSFLSISGSPITSSGTLAITLSGTALPVANGGTGLTSFTAGYIPYGNGTGALNSSSNLIFDGTNLGIGTSSPSTILNVIGTTGIRIRGANSASDGAFDIRANNTACILNANTYGALVPMIFQIGGTEASRIHASGGVSIGNTTDPGATNLSVSGQVLAGTTSAIASATGSFQSKTNNNNNLFCWNSVTSGDAGFIGFGTGSSYTQRGFIYYNSAAGLVQLIGTSDQRLKNNIIDAPSALSKILSIKVRQFNWKDSGNTNIGFIAQELKSSVPSAVYTGVDDDNGNIINPWGVDPSALIPYMIKAIQEQQTIIEQLQTKVGV